MVPPFLVGTNPLHMNNSAMAKLEKAGQIVGSESLRDKELTGLATLARTLKDENIRLSKQLLTYKKKEGLTDLKTRKQTRAATPRQKKIFGQTGEKVTKRGGGGETKEMEMSTAITGSMLKPRSFRIDDMDDVGEVHGTVPNPLHRSKSFISGSASSRRFIQKQEKERTLSVKEQEDERDGTTETTLHMML